MSHLRAPAGRADRREGGRHGRPVARTAPALADARLRPQLLRMAVLPPVAVALSGCAAVLFTVRSTGAAPSPALWAVLAGAFSVTVAGVVIAAVAADRAARTVHDRITGLRRSTARGEAELRTLVEQLRRGEGPPRRRPRSRPAADADEFELLAADLGRAHDGAVTAVVQASQLSSQAGSEQKLEVFVNLARRLQSLVHREISTLDELENEIEDPDLLKGLFHVDHLATRIRRHSENLAVLGGAVSRRQWSNPVPMTEVLRSAIAEVEQYSRVKLVPPVDGELRGHVVADVIHLLAELVENATVFSAPHTQVLLRTGLVTSGLAVEVEDRGLGMPAEEQSRMNAVLSDPDQVNVAGLLADGRIGLYVVSQLARRHGISVRLQSNIYGGVQAVLVVPQDLLGPAPAASGAVPRPHRPSTANGQQQYGTGAGAPAAVPPATTAGVRAATAGVRDAAAGVRDVAGGVRDAAAGVGGPAAGARDMAAGVRESATGVPGAAVDATGVLGVPDAAPQHGAPGLPAAADHLPHQPVVPHAAGADVPGAPDTPSTSVIPGAAGSSGTPVVPDALSSSGTPVVPGGAPPSGAPLPPQRRGARHAAARDGDGPPPLPVRGAHHERPTPADAVPGIRPEKRRVLAEHEGVPPLPRAATVRGTMAKPGLPRRRAQEHLVPQLRDGPVPRRDTDDAPGHDPGLMAAFQRGIGLAEAQQHLAPGEFDAAGPAGTAPAHPALAHPESGHLDPGHRDPGLTAPSHVNPVHLAPGLTVAGHLDPGPTVAGHRDPGLTAPSHGDPGHLNRGLTDADHLDPGHPEPLHPEPRHPDPGHAHPAPPAAPTGSATLAVRASGGARPAGYGDGDAHGTHAGGRAAPHPDHTARHDGSAPAG